MNLVIVTWIPRITLGFIFLFDDNQLYKKQKKLNLICRTFLPSSVHETGFRAEERNLLRLQVHSLLMP